MPDPAQAASIVIVRTGDVLFSDMPSEIYVDGELIARMGPGHVLRFRLPAGSHMVGLPRSSAQGVYDAGVTYYFRVRYTISKYEPQFDRITEAQAGSMLALVREMR